MATRSGRGFGQYDGVGRALERVGERWALLIIRDLLCGARRYSDLKAGLPRIPTNILSDRLKELQESGVIRRVPTVRGGYELTSLGRALEPAVLALERWGWMTLGDAAEGEALTADGLATAVRAAFRPESADGLPSTEYVLHVGDVSVDAIVSGASLRVVAIGPGTLPAPRGADGGLAPEDVVELTVETAGIRALLSGGGRDAEVRATDRALLTRFRQTFRLEAGPGPLVAPLPAADNGHLQAGTATKEFL